MRSLPFPAWWLGLGGLVPFASASAVVLAGPPGWQAPALVALIAYGAVILAFLGAVHWGIALGDSAQTTSVAASRLILGVLPALVGWGALLLPAAPALAVLGVGFLVVWAIEERAARHHLMPVSYRRLRRVLTAAVVAMLTTVLADLLR